MSLGGAPLGGLYRASSDADAIATIGAALSRGISHADVAPQYGQGLAEHRVGVGLAAHPGGRMTLSTKVGRLLEPATPDAPANGNWPEALPFATIYDVTPAGIRRSVQDSVRRMGGRRPDLLLLHDPDRYANGPDLIRVIAEAYRTLVALRAEGSVGAIGMGVNTPEPCHLALDLGDWDCFLLAGTYSTIRQDDRGLLDRSSQCVRLDPDRRTLHVRRARWRIDLALSPGSPRCRQRYRPTTHHLPAPRRVDAGGRAAVPAPA